MIRFVLGLVLLGLGLSVLPGLAQIAPPKPGMEFPPSYYQRLQKDKGAFQFKRAWKTETRRVRERRESLLQRGLLSPSSVTPGTRVEGTRRVPVLVGKYSNTGADPYTDTDLQQQLYDGPNATGTITDFYGEISYGYLTLTGDVIGDAAGGLFQVANTDTYYEGAAGCNGLCGSANTGEFLKELLDASDPRVDFSQYDNDGPDGLPNSGDDDGFVDFVAFVHPEPGGECGGNNMWSHRWVYEGWWPSAYTTNDPAIGGGFIKVSDYTIQPLLSCDGTSLIEIGVYSHEFGHAFGLPDLYDTDSNDGSSAGIGQWGLMGSGSWGGDGNHPETPSHMGAWSKEQLGWVQPTVVCGDQTGFALPAVEDTAVVLKIYPHGKSDSEYFLVENRTQTGFDTWLPVSGLAVWHIDNDQSGNGDETHKLVDLEEADGNGDLDANTNRGDSGDLFPGSGNTLLFDDNTTPDARDYAGAATGFSISNILSTVDPRTFDYTLAECILGVGDVAVNDAPWGNNNGVLDSNERINLGVAVRNDFVTDVTGVVGTLASLTPGVTVLKGSVSYGTVTYGVLNYGMAEFEIEATGVLNDGDQVDFQLDLNGDGGYTSSETISLRAGSYVLLVEDDEGADNALFFQDAISGAGYAYVRHDIGTLGAPTLGQMQGALMVVWYAGQAGINVISASEQSLIQGFLDLGGRLFITGQDLGWGLVEQGSVSDRTFYETYLHANYVADTSNDNSVVGVAGDPIGDGLSFSLSGGTGAKNSTWPSEISARAGAFPVFEYSSGIYGTVRYRGSHEVVYMAFNFESISMSATRTTVMQRILDWLVPSDLVAPSVTLLSPAGGDTLNACVDRTITWTASDNVGVTEVDILYSEDGGASFPHQLATGIPDTGSYLWSEPGVSGDLIRVQVKARDATGLQDVDTGTDLSVQPFSFPTGQVNAPNGSEVFGLLSLVPVSWTAADSCVGLDSVQVTVSLDGGSTWNLVATLPGSEKIFVWTTPDTTSDSTLVRVTLFDEQGLTGSDTSDGFFSLSASVVGIPDGPAGPSRPVLLQNFPNPTRAAGTTIAFYLAKEGPTVIRIYNLSGQLVRTLVEETLPAGYHEKVWDGTDATGRRTGQGIYFTMMRTGSFQQVRRLVKLK